ncbi:MAG: ribosome small subunit-dependent GTPase A [Acidobacteriota bacterium]
MAKKRFRQRGRRRGGQRDQRLAKEVRQLYDGGDTDDAWTEYLGDDLAENPTVVAARGTRSKSSTPPDIPEPDGPRRDGTVVSLASGLAWIEPDAPDELLAEGDLTVDDLPLLCILPTALAQDQQSRIAVGDRIVFARHGDDHRVIEVRPRRTFLARPDPLNPRQRRVVVANVDTIVQVASVRRPPLRPALVDRYLVAIQQGGAEPILCVNKIDLVPETERAQALEPLAPHRDLIQVLPISAETGEGVEALRRCLAGKIAAFVGHSGVGKSSLINALDPAVGAKTGAVSAALSKGRHTTTRSSLYELGDGIRVVDTPGIRELGLADLSAEELREYFPDLAELSAGCRFSNCTHDHEPRCAVRTAVETGELAASRYATYLRILASLSP